MSVIGGAYHTLLAAAAVERKRGPAAQPELQTGIRSIHFRELKIAEWENRLTAI